MDKGHQQTKAPSRDHLQNRAADGVRFFPNNFHWTGDFISTLSLHVGRQRDTPAPGTETPRRGNTHPATSPWSCLVL